MINETEFCNITEEHEEIMEYEYVYYILNKIYILMIIFSLLYFYANIVYGCIKCNENHDDISPKHLEYSTNNLLMKKTIENIYNKICKLQIRIEKLNKKQKKNYKKIRGDINKLMLSQTDNY